MQASLLYRGAAVRLPLFSIICALVLVLAGCATPSKTLASWLDHNSNELIASWGPPDRVFSDGQGGQIFVYTQTTSWVQPGSTTTTYTGNTTGSAITNYGNGQATTYGQASTYGQATTIYNPSYVQQYTKYRMFWISGDGTIYNWAWRGL